MSDAPYQLIIEQMNEGAATMTAQGVILYANRRLSELLKTPIAEIVGSTFDRFVRSHDQIRLHTLLHASKAQTCAGEVIARAADGAEVPLKLAFSRMTSVSSPIVCVIATDMSEARIRENELQAAHDELERRVAELARINTDLLNSRAAALNMMEDAVEARTALEQSNQELRREVAQRCEAQAALARSEDRYREMFMSDLSGAYVAAPNGKLLDCNPAFLAMFGFASLEEAQRVSMASLFKDPKAHTEMMEALAASGRMPYREQEYRTAAGKPLHLLESAVGVFDESGTLAEVRGYIVDTTARKELENQLRHAQKMEAIGKLAGGIAHDFNNVLCAILGYSELVLDRAQDDPAMVADLTEIRTAGERASRLTQQLLAFSRKTMAVPRQLNLNDVVTGVEKMLRRLIGEDVRLTIRTDRSLGKIKADPGLLDQVVMNLAINARDAMPRGGVLTLSTSNVTLDPAFVRSHVGSVAGEYVALTVSDTGHGIAPELIEHIFEPFFTTKAAGKGTGLGLSTVYGIVKQSGGYITVESVVGTGTTFTIYLPRVAAANEAIDVASASRLPTRGTETILIVEDETFVCDLVRKVLEPAGYTVLAASCAAEALAIAHNEPGPIDMLLTDVIMSDVHGPELAQQIRVLRPTIKVLYVSGFVDHAAVDLSALRLDEGFLAKPFTSEGLLTKVRERLDTVTPDNIHH
jgi:PAS domain S-box-containing protein